MGNVSSLGERPSRRRGTPGSYSVSPGYFGNSTADWAQLSSSSRLGPTDCPSPSDPGPTSGGAGHKLVGHDGFFIGLGGAVLSPFPQNRRRGRQRISCQILDVSWLLCHPDLSGLRINFLVLASRRGLGSTSPRR